MIDLISKRKDFPEGSAIVIGGSGGIGSAICKTFASHGVPVVFSYHGNETGSLRGQQVDRRTRPRQLNLG